jgi:hypothetical protein
MGEHCDEGRDGGRELAAVEPLEREWQELADRTSARPRMRPGWTAAWWRAFGHGRLEIPVVPRNGRVPTDRRTRARRPR